MRTESGVENGEISTPEGHRDLAIDAHNRRSQGKLLIRGREPGAPPGWRSPDLHPGAPPREGKHSTKSAPKGDQK